MSILRASTTAFRLAMEGRANGYSMADLFTITLQNGTIERYTSWATVLTVAGNLYSPALPWLKRGKWNLTNTMEVPTLEIYIYDNEQRNLSAPGWGGGSTGRTEGARGVHSRRLRWRQFRLFARVHADARRHGDVGHRRHILGRYGRGSASGRRHIDQDQGEKRALQHAASAQHVPARVREHVL